MATVELGAVGDRHTLLERDGQLAALAESFEEAAGARGRLVLVGGEAGVGKTTLARSFCAGVPSGAIILWGACDPLTTPRPLGPFLEIAETFEPVAEALSDGGGAYEVAAVLLGKRRARPLVLVLEDVHWADEATLDVLRILGRRAGGTPLLAVATYRDDELERGHPVRMLLGDLATATDVLRLQVEPLSKDGVSQLADGRGLDTAALYALTAGNPFYVTELLATGGATVPDTVRDIVLARVAQLGARAAAVVEAASVAPPSLDASLLLAVCGEAADSVDECLASGVLTLVDGGVAFRHELARTAVEDALSPARRLALHRGVLLALTEEHRESLDLARVAYHAEAARDRDAVLRFAPAAGEQAARVGAYREAAAQYARALQFAGGLSDSDRAVLLEGRSRACYLADDQVEAINVIEEAIACRRRAGDDAKQARALVELAEYLSCRGHLDDARGAIEEATRLLADEPDERELAWVYDIRSRFTLFDGDLDDCLALARKAIQVAERHGDRDMALKALVSLGTAELRRDVAAGRATLERAAALGRQQGNTEEVARALNNIGGFGAQRYDHELANTYLEAAFDYCLEHDEDLWRINVLALIARSRLDQGQWTEAAQFATELLQDPRDSPWPHHEALLVLGLVRARRGDPGAAEAVEQARAVGVPADEFDAIVDLAAATAEVAWVERRPKDVARATDQILSAAVERNAVDAICRLSYWRRLARLEAEWPRNAAGPYALGLAGEWAAAAEAWAALGCPYESAVALSHCNDEGALRRAYAELQGLGARPAAAIAARRLRERGARDVPSGPRARTRANPAGLTARELEVLRLLAEGLRNAEIAARLVLSRRTVDHHVSAILRKLGVESRGQAAVAAERLGLGQPR